MQRKAENEDNLEKFKTWTEFFAVKNNLVN